MWQMAIFALCILNGFQSVSFHSDFLTQIYAFNIIVLYTVGYNGTQHGNITNKMKMCVAHSQTPIFYSIVYTRSGTHFTHM